MSDQTAVCFDITLAYMYGYQLIIFDALTDPPS